MKLGNRTIALIAALIVLAVAGLAYSAGGQMRLADAGAQSAREASLHAYRVAQSLKASTAGYELTLNEFYSTVLDFSAYAKKSAEQKATIERELSILATLPDAEPKAIAQIRQLYKDIDNYRADLEKALTAAGGQDWDRAREALYKMNVLSVQAIHRADEIGQFANDRAVALDKRWQEDGSQARMLLNAATGLAVLAAIVLLLGSLLRPNQATA
jgi:hypothetical protein